MGKHRLPAFLLVPPASSKIVALEAEYWNLFSYFQQQHKQRGRRKLWLSFSIFVCAFETKTQHNAFSSSCLLQRRTKTRSLLLFSFASPPFRMMIQHKNNYRDRGLLFSFKGKSGFYVMIISMGFLFAVAPMVM